MNDMGAVRRAFLTATLFAGFCNHAAGQATPDPVDPLSFFASPRRFLHKDTIVKSVYCQYSDAGGIQCKWGDDDEIDAQATTTPDEAAFLKRRCSPWPTDDMCRWTIRFVPVNYEYVIKDGSEHLIIDTFKIDLIGE